MRMPLKGTRIEEGNIIPWNGIMKWGAQEVPFPSIVPQAPHHVLQNRTFIVIFSTNP